ncbi:YwmB family TATA-box binding protein [Proteinivorax tanatarense]|uniref:YwmB family TATA-box binding protein n=1 Tax=Proteinivorax tanatarense TaxID=1260629 RepID=A0AAU7VKY6_9FIRM
MEKTICIIIILLLSMASITLAIETTPAGGVDEIKSLIKVSEAMDGDVVAYSWQAHVKIEDKLDKDELNETLKEFLGENLSKAVTETSKDHAYGEWYSEDTYNSLSIVVDEENGHTYIVYSVELSNEKCLINWHNNLHNKISHFGEPFVAVNIHKIYDGNFNSTLKEKNIQAAFNAANSTFNVDSKGEGYVGYIGYTQEIDNYVMVNDDKVNLHITITTDNTADVEYINIATPLIINSY